MSACQCLSVALGGKYKTCEYHDWKKAKHARALARRKARNHERHIRAELSSMPSIQRRSRGKKARLNQRWAHRDRFGIAKLMAEALEKAKADGQSA